MKKRPAATAHDLPKVPSVFKVLGPSFLLLGLALGSGELILWPSLTATHGMGLIWGALLGISLQYILNTEVMRYTLYWGESVFVGLRRISILLTLWYILSTVIPWSLPAFASLSASIITHVFPSLSHQGVAIVLLLLTGIFLTSRRSVYATLEKYQKTALLVGIPFMLFLLILIAQPADYQSLFRGLAGMGDGWWLLPSNIVLTTFIAACAYSGAGGNLNLAQSYYIKEKGFGMGAYLPKLSTFFTGSHTQVMPLTGATFPKTSLNVKRWDSWWRLITLEHGLVFWFLGFVSIAALALLAASTVYGNHVESSGLSFLFFEATAIGLQTHPILGSLFVLVSALFLFSTQLGVYESASRIISENIVLLGGVSQKKKVHLGKHFSYVVWGLVGLGITVYVAGFQEPKALLTFSALLNAGAMLSSFLFILLLNARRLEPRYRPSWIRTLLMLVGAVFFGVLLCLLFFQT